MADPDEWRAARPRVAEAKRRLWNRHRRDPNVLGMAFGPPTRGGRNLDTPACVVLVERKLPEDELRPEQKIPPVVDVEGTRVETDVVETGRIYAYDYTSRMRPAMGGVSIGHRDITAGTLGCLVTDTLHDGRLSILSNNHVLANSNDASVGDPIYQPGPADAPKNPDNVIASLTRWVPIHFGDGGVQTANVTYNRVDAAIADPGDDCDLINHAMMGDRMTRPTPEQPAVGLLFAGGPDITVVCPINDVVSQLQVELTAGPEARSAVTVEDALPPGAPVQKTGRTTEYTTGRIRAIDGIVGVNYGGGKIAFFDGMIFTTPMSAGGDSGSVVCRGGSGDVIPPNPYLECPSMRLAEELTGIPFTQEWVSLKYARDTYLATSLVGRWLLDTFFENYNQQKHTTRAQNLDVTPEDRAYAQALYAQYASELKLVLYDPDRQDLRIRAHHLVEAEEALARMSKYLLGDEAVAAQRVLSIGQGMVGMNGRDVINQLDSQQLLDQLRDIVADMGAIFDPYD